MFQINFYGNPVKRGKVEWNKGEQFFTLVAVKPFCYVAR
jgi:hypothetical protein